MNIDKQEILENICYMQSEKLETIPGVGKAIARSFRDIGIEKVSDLKDKNPEVLYEKLCIQQGIRVDKCMLYVCRSSVYFAKTENPNPEKLKWWNWKD